jgi:hypothetical protein
MDEGDPQTLPLVKQLPGIGLMVDMGTQPEARIKRLKRGEGELARQVQAAVLQSRETLGLGTDVEIVPVVLLYSCGEPDYVVITS